MKKIYRKLIIIGIVSIIVFVGALYLQKSLLNPNGTSYVVVAQGQIEKNTVVSEDNIDKLFEVEERDSDFIVDNAITNKEQLLNKTIKVPMEGKEQVTFSKVEENNQLESIEKPIEVSLRANDISQIVGGILRTGDLINIVFINEVSKEPEVEFNEVYVSKAFASDGTIIGLGDTTSALTINVIIDASKEKSFNSALAKSNIRISKIK